MIQITFQDEDLQELITTGTNSGKYKKLTRDKKFLERLANVYRVMSSVEKTSDLESYSFLHYEKLKHVNTSSVRIMNNRVERLLFVENENGIEITLIELNETHYGNKK
jgi:plasmid maintenance system killer protein